MVVKLKNLKLLQMLLKIDLIKAFRFIEKESLNLKKSKKIKQENLLAKKSNYRRT